MSRFDKSRLPSRHVTEGAEKAPMRAMLLGTGLAPDDLDRPLIGVATTWSETSPCNMPSWNLLEITRKCRLRFIGPDLYLLETRSHCHFLLHGLGIG